MFVCDLLRTPPIANIHSGIRLHCCISSTSDSLQLMGVGYRCLLNGWVKEQCMKLEQIFSPMDLEGREDLGPLHSFVLLSNLKVFFNSASSRTTKPQKDWRQKDQCVCRSCNGPRDREMVAFTAKEHSASVSCSCSVHCLWQLLDFCQPRGQQAELDEAEESTEFVRQLKWCWGWGRALAGNLGWRKSPEV